MPTEEKKEERHARINTYDETACSCFTALRKRAAFAAASSRLVVAAVLLGFFGRLPKRVGAARLFRQMSPRLDGRMPAGGAE